MSKKKQRFDYARRDRLFKKARACRKHAKFIKQKTGKSPARSIESAAKKLAAKMNREDKKQREHKKTIDARDDFDVKTAEPFEKNLDKLLRFALDKNDPRRDDFDL